MDERNEQRASTTAESEAAAGGFSHTRVLAGVLIAATVIAVYLCYLLIYPFLPSLAWALALSVVGYPLHSWLAARIHGDNLAAAITVSVIALLVIVPAILMTERLAREAADSLKNFEGFFQAGTSEEPDTDRADDKDAGSADSEHAKAQPATQQSTEAPAPSARKQWKELVKNSPRLQSSLEWLDARVDFSGQIEQTAQAIAAHIPSVLSGSVWLLAELLITLFTLFYFLRDRYQATNQLRLLMPLSDEEANDIFARIADTIYATVYGTLIVAAAQGIAGGLIFYWLGLPAPLLWGVVMAMTGVIPVMGPFLVWLPAAGYLALEQNWVGAIVLFLWGALVITMGGHVLYVVLVGKRLHVHTLLVFFAFAGGLVLFGAAGLILGPLILAATDALLQIWRKRTAASLLAT